MDQVADDACEGSSLTAVKDESYRRDLLSLFRELRSHASSNVEYFREPAGGTANADPSKTRLFEAFCLLREHVDRGVQPGVEYLIGVAHFYDVDSLTMANGYRSFIVIVERCCQRLLTISRCYIYSLVVVIRRMRNADIHRTT